MMSPYVDTSLLAKLYTYETKSTEAVRFVQAHPIPLPLTEWQELELRTALRTKTFRQEIDAVALRTGLERLAADISAGRRQCPAYLQADVFERAENLSDRHAATIGCRTLDILHVAAALVIGAQDFLTSDMRQAELARRAGMNVRTV